MEKIKDVKTQRIHYLLRKTVEEYNAEEMVNIPLNYKGPCINRGYCANFVKECLTANYEELKNYDVKVCDWEGIHTFLIIDGCYYDADRWGRDDLKWNSETRRILFIRHTIDPAIDFGEYYKLVTSKDDSNEVVDMAEICNTINTKELWDVKESYLTVDEFLSPEKNKELNNISNILNSSKKPTEEEIKEFEKWMVKGGAEIIK